MRQLFFDELRSFNDLNLILSSSEIGSPSIKIKTVDIDGRDGVLDLTDFLGTTNYTNRLLKFSFGARKEKFNYSDILNKLHGKKVKISISDDPNWYYWGRLSVSSYIIKKGIVTIDIEADCDPYRYRKLETIITNKVDGESVINLINSRKPVVPLIETSTAMQIEFGNKVFNVDAGSRYIDIMLLEGENVITVTGNGEIKITYQEGSL